MRYIFLGLTLLLFACQNNKEPLTCQEEIFQNKMWKNNQSESFYFFEEDTMRAYYGDTTGSVGSDAWAYQFTSENCDSIFMWNEHHRILSHSDTQIDFMYIFYNGDTIYWAIVEP